MSDLIYRQKAIEALMKNRAFYCDNTPESFRYLSYGEKCRVDEIDACIAELMNLPSTEPERGRWKSDKKMTPVYDSLFEIEDGYFCSECGNFERTISNYCPHCGCQMEDEEE